MAAEMPDMMKTQSEERYAAELKVVAAADERAKTNELVESLMGRRPELRFQFIQEHAGSVIEVDV